MKKYDESISSLRILKEYCTIVPGQVLEGGDERGRPVRLLAVLTFPVILAGCGVPMGISAASYVADGLSLGASGKSVNDHALSQLVNMDCGLLRFLDGDWICRERGLDPDDDTIYLADGPRHEGPPRPWGTSRNPNLQYENGLEHDAREWATGTDLAVVDIGDDGSGRLVATNHASADTYVGPKEIGDLSERREREEKLAAVAERIQFAQALEMQYRQMMAVETTVIRADSSVPTAAVAPRRAPASVVFVDNLQFSHALGLRESYETAEGTMVAELAEPVEPNPTADAGRSPASPPMFADARSPNSGSGNAIGATGYGGRGASPESIAAGPQDTNESRPMRAVRLVDSSLASANAVGPAFYGRQSGSWTAVPAAIKNLVVADENPSFPSVQTRRQPTESQPSMLPATPSAPKTLPRQAPREWRVATVATLATPIGSSGAEIDSYLVVGSYGDQSNARAAVSRFGGVNLKMIESMVDGEIYYRVVSGPYAEAQLPMARQNLRTAGLSESWRISPCGPSSANGDGCLSETALVELRDADTDDDPRPVQVAGARR